MEAEPLRTCVVTREQLPAERLLRLTLAGDHVVAAGSGGRGAYVSIAREALTQLDARALSRALRQPVRDFQPEELMAQTHELAGRRVRESLGLARRASAADFGVDAILVSRHVKDPNAVAICATDLSERSRRDLDGARPEGNPARAFDVGAALGHAAGMGFLGAALLHPGHLARDAAYWLSVWYETAPNAPGRANEVAA